MKRDYKRRNYFVKKNYQGRYVFIFFLLVVFGSVVFSIIFSLFSAGTLSISYDNYNLQVGATPLILMKKILAADWLFIVSGGLFVVILSIFLTHRVAGPMHRLEKNLDQMRKGILPGAIVLRKKDDGKELADKINQFNMMLKDRLLAMRGLNKEMEANLAALHAISGDLPKDNTIRRKAERIMEINNQLLEVLNAFTIQD